MEFIGEGGQEGEVRGGGGVEVGEETMMGAKHEFTVVIIKEMAEGIDVASMSGVWFGGTKGKWGGWG